MGTETFRITREQAELYEERFVPALFGNWVDPVLDAADAADAADAHAGHRLLDVACGTGWWLAPQPGASAAPGRSPAWT